MATLNKIVKTFGLIIIFLGLLSSSLGVIYRPDGLLEKNIEINNLNTITSMTEKELIRFHVVANSDSDEDQNLKRAVRDAILEQVSPRLAQSGSLEESRQLLVSLMPEMKIIAEGVVSKWGKDYPIRTDYSRAIFPTKSYGSLVLPAGEYEAVRILIGEAEGSNWWCVLFPPLCFIDIEHSTAVPVDGKPGIPIEKEEPERKATKYEVEENKNTKVQETKKAVVQETKTAEVQDTKIAEVQETKNIKKKEPPIVKSWFWEMAKKLMKLS